MTERSHGGEPEPSIPLIGFLRRAVQVADDSDLLCQALLRAQSSHRARCKHQGGQAVQHRAALVVARQRLTPRDKLTLDLFDNLFAQHYTESPDFGFYSLPGSWDAGWSLGSYAELRPTIYRFKYAGQREQVQAFIHRSLALFSSGFPFEVIVPLPPGSTRDYQPVVHFAEGLGTELGVRVSTDLKWGRPTRLQKSLVTPAEKVANVRDAFNVAVDTSARRILLVDDVLDSGASLHEATRALRAAGASQVFVLTLTHRKTNYLSAAAFEHLRSRGESPRGWTLLKTWLHRRVIRSLRKKGN